MDFYFIGSHLTSTVIVMLHTHGSNASSCHSLELIYLTVKSVISLISFTKSTSSLNPLACVANGERAEAELKSCLKQRGQGKE